MQLSVRDLRVLRRRREVRGYLIGLVVVFLICAVSSLLVPYSVSVVFFAICCFCIIGSLATTVWLLYSPCPVCEKRFSWSGWLNFVSFPPLGAFAEKCANCGVSIREAAS